MSDFDLSVLQAELAKLQNISQLAENLSAVQEHSKNQLNEVRELRRVMKLLVKGLENNLLDNIFCIFCTRIHNEEHKSNCTFSIAKKLVAE